ncbi:hypothetical protein J25TS5_04220 [Paenibacillus faecis]|uniref:BC1872 family protein n=1 Tax=Paenibacillus faecis TaxID=862114 RepID=UPI001B25834B|nr:hypothetical protein [Paenibacillus faecis]GIO83490.1 hypothetical protein J25TS5_04220 [Paenibacillus faecis]
MTLEEILAMGPGRELDALVAEKVMLWEWNDEKTFSQGNYVRIDPPYAFDHESGEPRFNWSPSTEISAAWEVVEKMRQKNYIYELADFGRNTHKSKPHYAAFHPINKPRNYERQVHSKTLPEAICKAALLGEEEA